MKKKLFLMCLVLLYVAGCSNNRAQKAAGEEAEQWHVAFWANLNANLENCLCGDPPLGGLDRIAYAVDSLRTIYPGIVVIDGGDTFTPYSFPEYNRLVLEAFEIVRPDIWLAGEQERLEVQGNNGRFDHSADVFVKDSLLVMSWVEPQLTASEADLQHEKFEINLNERRDETHYSVLLFHGSYEHLNAFTERYPVFDLVLFAHEQSRDIDLIGVPPRIGGFADGEVLVHIRIDKKEPYTIAVEKLEMGLNRTAHPGFASIIEKSKRLTSKQEDTP